MKKELNEEELSQNPSIIVLFRRTGYERLMKEVEKYANEGKTYEEVINIMLGEYANSYNKNIICSQDIYDYYVEHGLINKEDEESIQRLVNTLKEKEKQVQEEMTKEMEQEENEEEKAEPKKKYTKEEIVEKIIDYVKNANYCGNTIEGTATDIVKKLNLNITPHLLGRTLNVCEEELNNKNVFFKRRWANESSVIRIEYISNQIMRNTLINNKIQLEKQNKLIFQLKDEISYLKGINTKRIDEIKEKEWDKKSLKS